MDFCLLAVPGAALNGIPAPVVSVPFAAVGVAVPGLLNEAAFVIIVEQVTLVRVFREVENCAAPFKVDPDLDFAVGYVCGVGFSCFRPCGGFLLRGSLYRVVSGYGSLFAGTKDCKYGKSEYQFTCHIYKVRFLFAETAKKCKFVLINAVDFI